MDLQTLISKSVTRLQGLHPVVRAKAEQLIRNCYARGVAIRITQGLRTNAEQAELYAKGRTKPGNIVTNAKPGTSYHNYGLAIDFVLQMPDGKNVSWDMNADFNKSGVKDWTEVVIEAKRLGFYWGGDFKSFKDYPHFEYTFGLSIAQLKAGKRPPDNVVAMPTKPIESSVSSVLVVGSRGGAVEQLQANLLFLGYNTGAQDGIYGERTKEAVWAFQKDNKIGIDGKAGPVTLDQISRGTIRKLQGDLAFLGYDAGAQDGIYGKRTEEAIRKFQKDNKIGITGKADPVTLDQILRGVTKWKLAAQAQLERSQLVLNGQKLDIQAIFRDGVNYVPVRSLCGLLGGTFGWNTDTAKVTINGKDIEDSQVFNGVGHVPIRDFASFSGLVTVVGWDPKTRTVTLTKKAG